MVEVHELLAGRTGGADGAVLAKAGCKLVVGKMVGVDGAVL